MQIKYFQTAWNDIKNSPGWFGKLCLLALLNLIPIFGQMVTLGYLYGWAREISWGTHAPLPKRIFDNSDGKFWRRGWFALVIGIVFAIAPAIIMGIGNQMQTVALQAVINSPRGMGGNPALGGFGSLLYLVGLVGTLLLMMLAWVGRMRSSIYDRLSAGFQLGKIWKMFRHDTGGIMRIFGMYLLVGLIVGIVLGIIVSMLLVIVFMIGAAGMAATGMTADSLRNMNDMQSMLLAIRIFASAGVFGFIVIMACIWISVLASLFVDMLVVRALGYWTMQFDVPRWRGQDEPMPFETQPAAPAAAQPMPPVAAPIAQQPPVNTPFDASQQGAAQPTEGVAPATAQPFESVASATAQPFESVASATAEPFEGAALASAQPLENTAPAAAQAFGATKPAATQPYGFEGTAPATPQEGNAQPMGGTKAQTVQPFAGTIDQAVQATDAGPAPLAETQTPDPQGPPPREADGSEPLGKQ